MNTSVNVSEAELTRRTIRRDALVSCNQAFIDCRTPGSHLKENYALIGNGVSQSDGQFINLQEDHGYNIGAAAMPNGVTNSLHMHFTAEVFFNFGGEWKFRWGRDGADGEYVSHDGDIVTVPTWIFRGFTNVGPDNGWLFTALGQSDTGGIIWGNNVLEEAEGHGMYLTSEGRLIDTVAGDEMPPGDDLIRPLPDDIVDSMRGWTVEQMRARITSNDDLEWCDEPFLCSLLPGGGAQLATVIGYGMTENRDQTPRVFNPHSFNVAWLRASVGEGVLRHYHNETQVVIVKSGRWKVTLNEGAEQRSVELNASDTLSIPPGAWRAFEALEAGDEGMARLLVVNGGDGRVRLHWSSDLWREVSDKGISRDADGYVAPSFLLAVATEDD
ncbi:cupin domain-containing protein [Micrococcales bacterium 31B]|nr:cupin domain-containing protein [Micrococcales bacterium 31B]